MVLGISAQLLGGFSTAQLPLSKRLGSCQCSSRYSAKREELCNHGKRRTRKLFSASSNYGQRQSIEITCVVESRFSRSCCSLCRLGDRPCKQCKVISDWTITRKRESREWIRRSPEILALIIAPCLLPFLAREEPHKYHLILLHLHLHLHLPASSLVISRCSYSRFDEFILLKSPARFAALTRLDLPSSPARTCHSFHFLES